MKVCRIVHLQSHTKCSVLVMKLSLEKQLFALITLWYLVILGMPYDVLGEVLGEIRFPTGVVWPISFLILDCAVVGMVIAYSVLMGKCIHQKKLDYYWLLLGILLLYPLFTVWATLSDTWLSPIR
jgi:hypothetical protein